MGCLQFGKAQVSSEIDDLIRFSIATDKRKDEEVMKLLLLGTGDSGKSTLFKQLVHLYGKDFDADSRSRYVKTIYSNALLSMKKLAKQSVLLADQKLPQPATATPATTTLAAAAAAAATAADGTKSDAAAGDAKSDATATATAAADGAAAPAADGSAAASAAPADRRASTLAATSSTRMQSTDAVDAARIIEEAKYDAPLDRGLADAIKTLWADPGIRVTYAHRGALFQCMHSCGYFFDKIDAIVESSYLPTYTDILMCRARTTGIVETSFAVGDYNFRLLDVGGQRNERRKWIHCFEKVTALLFISAISEYDEVLYEDHTVNRVVESINLFSEICSSKWFTDTSIVLFLNKSDLFLQKIKNVDLTCVFPEYTGGCDAEKGLEYIKEMFLKQNVSPNRKVYVHVTCATDTSNVAFTFKAVTDMIVAQRASEAGFKVGSLS